MRNLRNLDTGKHKYREEDTARQEPEPEGARTVSVCPCVRVYVLVQLTHPALAETGWVELC